MWMHPVKYYLLLLAVILGTISSASAQSIFSCASGFSTSGSCGVALVGAGGQPFGVTGSTNGVTPAFNGSQINLIPIGATHVALSLNYQTLVNIQSFTSTFTFVPNGSNFVFVIQNSNNNLYFNGAAFSAGAGCEAGFYQAFGQPAPNNIFALELDSYSPLTESGSFTYSSAQIYQSGQSPCLPNDSGPNYYPTNKISTSPVNLTSGSPDTSTGDVYSTTVTYDGTSFTLNMYNVTAGGSCPGASCFSYVWPVDIPTWVGGTTAYVGFTGGTGGASSYPLYVNSFSYAEGSTTQASSPTFSPTAGTYSGAQSITLSSATAGAAICYNTTGSPATNGSTGCASGTLYTGPVTVSTSETLYAVAGGTGHNDSAVGSAPYVIQTSVATPTFSPGAGTYSSAQSVAISDATSNATIYYTTDGTAPTVSSTRYAGPIPVSSTEKLEAIAVAAGATNSVVATAAYTITPLPVAGTPTFSPASGTYSSAQSVTLSDTTSGATVYYTINGTAPTTSSTEYIGPISVSSTEKLEAIALAPGNTNSAVATAAYTINSSLPVAATPTFSPAAGTYSSAQSVTLSDATSDATIYYTTNGTAPTSSSTEYTGPITVSSTETLEAIAVASGDTNSGVASTVYTILSSLPLVATPTFSPAAGAYTSGQLVTLSDAISVATIYYTTDGTTPTTSSSRYTSPITVSSTETLEAIAVATGDSNSAVASAAYTITPALPSVSTPTFSPAGGTYPSAQSVTLSDASSDATIYYTTNGTAPTTSSAKYTGPITVSSTETLEAIAVATSDSAIASAAYSITAQPNFLLGASASSLMVNPGGQGTVTLTVTPVNGFDSPVVLACSGLPVGATCSFDQATVTPAGAAATTQLTISASPPSSALRTGSRPFFPLATLAMTVGLFGWRKRRGWHAWLLVLMAYVGLGLLSGCGVSGVTGGTSTGAASTTSTVTVTAISGALQGEAAIALTVN
jgi:hypothetical protein